MHGENLWQQVVVYLAAAVVAVPLAKRLGFGSVLGYLVAGAVIGPFALGFVGREGADVMHFAEFGVVMLLFVIGLELEPGRLWRLRVPIVGLGGLQVAATGMLLAALGLLAGWSWGASLGAGLILALSSTAIVLQSLSEQGLLRTDAGQSAFAVLLFQDLAVIPLLAVLPLLALAHRGHHAGAAQAAPGPGASSLGSFTAPLLIVLGAVAVILLGRWLVRPVLGFIARARLREVFTAATLLLVVGAALLAARVGLSPALGTFLAGVMLASSEYRHELESDLEPFKGLLLGVFFIAVGASVDFAAIGAQPLRIGVLLLVVVLAKLGVLLALGRLFRMSPQQSALFAFALAQGGEFGFVLVSFAAGQGVLAPEQATQVVAVIALSMAVAPLLMLAHDKLLAPRLAPAAPRAEGDALAAIDEASPVIIAGFGRVGSIVGRLLRAQGVRTTVLDVDSDHVAMLGRLGIKVFYGDAERRELLAAAGAAQAKLLIVAVDDPEKVLSIARTARTHFPKLKLLVRASGRSQAYELLDAGFEHVFRETLDSSLQVGVAALRELGFPAYQAARAARAFRRFDEASLRELRGVRHDAQAYLNQARQRLRDMETLLRDERDAAARQGSDAAWDASAVRQDRQGDNSPAPAAPG